MRPNRRWLSPEKRRLKGSESSKRGWQRRGKRLWRLLREPKKKPKKLKRPG